MKTKLTILILMLCIVCFSCGRAVQEPQRVIIANNEIITIEQLLKHEKEEDIKALHNGISDEKREQLLTIFGEKLPPKEHIVYVELFTEEERLERLEIIYPLEALERRFGEVLAANRVLHTNDTAKDFTVQMLDGTTITLSDLRGQVVLLYFWTTTCGPCIRAFRVFPSKIIEPFKQSAFTLLPISVGEPIDRVERKMAQLKEQGVNFNVGIDPERAVSRLYIRTGVPHTFLIDKDGIIRYASTGGFSVDVFYKVAFMIERMLIASAIDELLVKKNLTRVQH